MSVRPDDSSEKLTHMIAGVLDRAIPTTVFLDPTEDSYKRLGQRKAPRYVSWSAENRSQLVRIPAASKEFRRAELRSPDPTANPYIAFALLIWAGLDGIQSQAKLPEPVDVNLYKTDEATVSRLARLPENVGSARSVARNDHFVRSHIPAKIMNIYCAE